MSNPVIGVIADDFTGATDVGVAFRRAGLRTGIFFGIPEEADLAGGNDVLVIALKSRTAPVVDAVELSTRAYDWLAQAGATQFFFKYCSTFDSTAEGNIGPVLDALSARSGSKTVVQTPSSPDHQRTQYLGHLFVGGSLLSESPMASHPLTPMSDSLLPRLLSAQTASEVSLIALDVVRRGASELRLEIARREDSGAGHLLVDAIDDDDLRVIGDAVVDSALVAGAAGLAGGFARALIGRHGASGLIARTADVQDTVGSAPAVVLSGSCSAATLLQLDVVKQAGRPAYHLDALALPDAPALAEGALHWFDALPSGDAPVIYSSSTPAVRESVQRELGVDRAAQLLESATALIARGLVERGVRRFVVAGGETSGAVVDALGITGGSIGPEAAPGVPWIFTAGQTPLALLLKSGNFGTPELLRDASQVPSPATTAAMKGDT